MKKFHWPLERLLHVTGQREQVLRGELMKLTGELARARQEIVARRAAVRAALAQVAASPAETRLAAQRLFLGHCEVEIRLQAAMEASVKALEGRREEAMRQLTAMRQSRRKLEQLRQRAWQEYQRELAQWEQKQMDEAGQIGFVRRVQAAAGAGAAD